MNFKRVLFLIMIAVLTVMASSNLLAQDKKSKMNKSVYKFETVYGLDYTQVKNQQRTGTCWSFASTSFIESELLRMGKGDFDLAEMYFVRHTYTNKATEYFRRHGLGNFSEGGQAHDVLNVIRDHGFVPEEVYGGNCYKGEVHNHSEMVAMVKGMLDGVLKNRRKGITTVWMDAVNACFDIYLGENPDTFEFRDKTYSPVAFAHRELNFNVDDYVELSSFTHHPFYKAFNLEVPDNWSNDYYYNLPLDELMKVMYSAIKNGYSICWDGDVSEAGFSHKNGVAIIPADDEKDNMFKDIVDEKEVSAELRQQMFDQLISTDDHLMHLVGISQDQNGKKYFITKNSWDKDSNDFGGLLNMSDTYIQLKTIAILVHKDAIPLDIARKLNLK